MFPLRRSLLARLALTLAATGLLPLAISFYQLRVNKDALLRQLESTHMVAARAAAARIEAVLAPLTSLARTVGETAAHSPPALAELLTGTLQTWPQVAGVWVFNARGEEVVRGERRTGNAAGADVAVAYDAAAPRYGFVEGAGRRWLPQGRRQ